MTRQSFEETFAEIYSEAYKLLCDKQERYGDTNIEQLGIHGVISRIAHDKSARAKKFLNGKIVGGKVMLEPFDDGEDESMADTLMDIANYALIAVALQRGKWGRQMDDGDRTLVRRLEDNSNFPVSKNKKDKLPNNLSALRVDILGVKK
jgi:hypothetical protein